MRFESDSFQKIKQITVELEIDQSRPLGVSISSLSVIIQALNVNYIGMVSQKCVCIRELGEGWEEACTSLDREVKIAAIIILS